MNMGLQDFHPAVAAWFEAAFAQPTAAQREAWPAIRSGRHALIAAPTGSGKTLAAFLAAIDELVRQGVAGRLVDATQLVYVSPLKALSNDVRINLEVPIEGIRAQLARLGLPEVEIRTAVRTGDTPQAERNAMRKRPPHIVVTTPESLYILLGSESGRRMLASTRSVIVDEIHALVQGKRGSHLALTLERLDALCGHRCTRIGLSATQKPLETVARFLVGASTAVPPRVEPLPVGASLSLPGMQPARAPVASSDAPDRCAIIDAGHDRARDLGIEVTAVPLQPVMSNDAWGLVYDRLAEMIGGHRTTLVFANTRRSVERATRHLAERLGKEAVAAHHGSLSKEKRLDAEQRLKHGQLRALVATASLELGIDIGDVDLVCQLGSPRSIAAFLQRAGRAGHAVDGTPRARLFPTSRDDLVECAALLDAVRRGELDILRIPPAPLDVLAQQIVAEVACGERDESALYESFRCAWPYRDLARDTFTDVVRMLAEGYSTRRGTRAAYLHRDAVNGKLRARRAARLTALTSGGAIPDTADYDVVLEPQALKIGSVHEDFAVESIAGDIFQLGNQSYRILRVERGRVRVEDAQGAPPSIPFWLGEAPGRSDELSFAVSRLRAEIAARLAPLAAPEPSPPTPLPKGEGSDAMAHRVDPSPSGTVASRNGGTPSQRGEIAAQPGPLAVSEPSPPTPLPEGEGSDAMAHRVDPSPSGTVASRDGGTPSQRGEIAARPGPLAVSEPSPPTPLREGEGSSAALSWLVDEVGVCEAAARQLVEYLTIARAELGLLPTFDALAMERFFDDSGGMQLVIHSPYGSRLNRAWGLALRKRFCRSFNFELQAAATEDAIVLSLSTSHSFPLDEVARYLHSNSVTQVLTQALLDAPMFALRFRWNAGAALALPRVVGGSKVPPQIQRMKSEDLLATVFPDQVACLENIVGERSIPDHPLIAQTLDDCLHEAMDLDGLVALLKRLEAGSTRIVARDLTAPSALAAEVLGARPYAYLDDAPLEERRTQAVSSRGSGDATRADDLGKLDADAIAAVCEEAWPAPRDADEMHEALLVLGAINDGELARHPAWQPWLGELASARRATRMAVPPPADEGHGLWIAAETLPMWRAVFPEAAPQPALEAPAEFAKRNWTRDDALVEILRGRLGCMGVTDPASLAQALALPRSDVDIALATLEREGGAMRGRFTPGAPDEQWCERSLLARIHRRTLQRLRREIEPVEPVEFMRFLLAWQHLAPATRLRGPDGLAAVLAQLEGFEAAAGAWESQLLPARVADYDIAWLDALCGAGRVAWTRLRAPSTGARNAPVRASPIVLLPRSRLAAWRLAGTTGDAGVPGLSSRAQAVADCLAQQGASFFGEIADATRLLKVELEDALGELVAAGMVGSDSFAGLRALLLPASRRNRSRQRRLARHLFDGIEDAGRWSLVRAATASSDGDPRAREEAVEHVARTLLRRWGVVFWTLLQREAAWLPPWRELRRVYQRLEARGEIRGGRFVAGVAGEQFALPDAIGALRNARRQHDETPLAISGADPLNVVGSVLSGERVPALAGSRIVLRDGLPVAVRIAGEVRLLQALAPADERAVRACLQQLPTGRHGLPLRA